MTINGKRNFKFNGKKYQVMNMYEADRKNPEINKDPKNKYSLAVADENGIWRNCVSRYNLDGVFFKTIKEAQRYVRDWDFTLTVF